MKIAFYICLFIFALIFAIQIYSLIRFRQSKGPQVVHFHRQLSVEILWTIVPFIIAMMLVFPAARFLL